MRRPKMRQREALIGAVLALILFGNVAAARAASGQPRYRTRDQAEHYLEYGLQTWNHNGLGHARSRAAYCINGSAALRNADEDYLQGRKSRSGADVYRTFACTLYTHVDNRAQVLGLYLVTTRTGWRVAALH